MRIRRKDQNPPQASIYDVIPAVTGLNGNRAGKAYRDLTAMYPEVHSPGVNFRFLVAAKGTLRWPMSGRDHYATPWEPDHRLSQLRQLRQLRLLQLLRHLRLLRVRAVAQRARERRCRPGARRSLP